ncbi:MAG: class I SAM-dependent methyltransferase [Oscillospiraceae bacterium]|nr:class I SAM-dependent methyltransferase [Oscillospiraceae bacterium]
MNVSKLWNDYQLLDASDGKRLECWGRYFLVRPDPQVIFSTDKLHPKWKTADAYYHRSASGGGHWEYMRQPPVSWSVCWDNHIRLKVMLTSFKHTGVFPEQGVNWDIYQNLIASSDDKVEVLNLFGYTGGASVACLKAGASVCHVDASKGMIAQAKENCILSGVREQPIRFIAEDCRRFIEREIRRNKKYDAVIMDPPSYGRGPSGERWKLEDDIFSLVNLTKEVVREDPLFFVINSYSASLSPSVMQVILSLVFGDRGGSVTADELGIPIVDTEIAIPSGATAYYIAKDKTIKKKLT